MALQGTLDTFALADLVRLLATTEKTGELAIDGDDGRGRLWFAGGDIVGGEPAPSGDVVDALFALLRLDEGDFRFDVDVAPDEPAEARRALEVLDAAEERLEAWRPVEALVPSPAVTVALRAVIDDEVRVDPATWRSLVAVAASRTAGELAVALGMDHVATAFAVRDLVEAGLVEVGEIVEVDETVEAAPPALDMVEGEAVVAEVPVTDEAAGVFEPVEIVPLEVDLADEPAAEPEPADEPWTPIESLPTIASAAELLASGGPLADDMAAIDSSVRGSREAVAPDDAAATAEDEVETDSIPTDEIETDDVTAEGEDADEDVHEEPAAAETLAEALPSLDALPTLDASPADALPALDALPSLDGADPVPGSLAVDLDAQLGGAATDHSYLDRAAGADSLPEPLPSAPASSADAPVGDATAESDRAPWPAPSVDRDEEVPLDALSPAAAAAVAAAATEGATAEVEAGRRVLRRIISTGKG